MRVAYAAVLEISVGSVLFQSGLPHAERARRGTRQGRRVLETYKQAVLVRAGSSIPECRLWPGTTASLCRRPIATGTRASRCSRPATVPARGPAGGESSRSLPHHRGRHADPHRPDLHPALRHRRGPVVEWQAPPRWEHLSRLSTRRVATVDLRRTTQSRIRHQRHPRRPRSTGPHHRLD